MESLAEKITKAQEKRDIERLRQLHHALTSSREVSHYAQMPLPEVEEAARMAEEAIARLTPQKRAKRPAKPQEPLDFSVLELQQSDLFEDVGKWPRRPYCTHDLQAGLKIRTLRHALLHPYIQANPPHLRVWLLHDIDRPGAATAWESAALPPPTWTAINKVNGHAHSAWGITAPVLVDGMGARDAPMRFLAAIEAMMQERLQADPGFGGLITKNPAHPLWLVLRGPRLSYSLGELAEALPGIEKFRPKKAAEKVKVGGVLRNVTLFDTLRRDAYSAIRQYWGCGLHGWNAWLSRCNSRALVMNADLFQTPLQGNEVWHVAKSVAKWVWRNFSPDGFSEWQSVQGRKGAKKGGLASGVARLAASEDKRASARLMRANGMTQTSIAAELNVHVNTVANWLRNPQ